MPSITNTRAASRMRRDRRSDRRRSRTSLASIEAFDECSCILLPVDSGGQVKRATCQSFSAIDRSDSPKKGSFCARLTIEAHRRSLASITGLSNLFIVSSQDSVSSPGTRLKDDLPRQPLAEHLADFAAILVALHLLLVVSHDLLRD